MEVKCLLHFRASEHTVQFGLFLGGSVVLPGWLWQRPVFKTHSVGWSCVSLIWKVAPQCHCSSKLRTHLPSPAGGWDGRESGWDGVQLEACSTSSVTESPFMPGLGSPGHALTFSCSAPPDGTFRFPPPHSYLPWRGRRDPVTACRVGLSQRPLLLVPVHVLPSVPF